MKSNIKKILILLIASLAVISCVSCGEKMPTPEEEGIVPYDQIPIPSGVDCDIDLTAVNVQLKNSKVFEILTEHDKYSGVTVKIDGRFKVITNNGKKVFACEFVNAEDEFDQLLEFILEGDKKYPDDYPKKGEDIVVIGTLQKYEGGIHLINARLIKDEVATTTKLASETETGTVKTATETVSTAAPSAESGTDTASAE